MGGRIRKTFKDREDARIYHERAKVQLARFGTAAMIDDPDPDRRRTRSRDASAGHGEDGRARRPISPLTTSAAPREGSR